MYLTPSFDCSGPCPGAQKSQVPGHDIVPKSTVLRAIVELRRLIVAELVDTPPTRWAWLPEIVLFVIVVTKFAVSP